MQTNYPKVTKVHVAELYNVLTQMLGSHITKTYEYAQCGSGSGTYMGCFRHHIVAGVKPDENWETLTSPSNWGPTKPKYPEIDSDLYLRINYNYQVEYGNLYRQSIAGLYERSYEGLEMDVLAKQSKKNYVQA